jgi:hypothetical protein
MLKNNKFKRMKKVIGIAICILGIMSISSCRSTYKPCGLAENPPTQTNVNQTDIS